MSYNHDSRFDDIRDESLRDMDLRDEDIVDPRDADALDEALRNLAEEVGLDAELLDDLIRDEDRGDIYDLLVDARREGHTRDEVDAKLHRILERSR